MGDIERKNVQWTKKEMRKIFLQVCLIYFIMVGSLVGACYLMYGLEKLLFN